MIGTNFLLVVATTALLCTSCAQSRVNGIAPITAGIWTPAPNDGWARPPKVESCKPIMRWHPADTAGATYDLIVYRGVSRGYGYVGGNQVYYRSNLTETSHQMEDSLQPKTVYVWSVRTRIHSQISDWSTYDFHRGLKGIFGPGYPVECRNWWWTFRTPGQ